MPKEDKKDPIDELKDKALEEVAEAAEDLVEELVEDLTDGKDNSANPWYKRWWNSWTKGVSVLAIIGGLGTWGMQTSIEWYKERKDREYERIKAVEKQLEEVNRRLAVQNEAMKAMNEARKDNNNERMAMWRALRENDESYDEMKVQVRINAILNERNYKDIQANHALQSQSTCNHDKTDKPKEDEKALHKPDDVKNLSALQKAIKRTLGTPEEKKLIKDFDDRRRRSLRKRVWMISRMNIFSNNNSNNRYHNNR
jgi:hypothetical protein